MAQITLRIDEGETERSDAMHGSKTGFRVICQKWEESERGWGIRPDGFSLHLSEEDRIKYIKAHWDSLPDDYVPDTYSRPSGTPYQCDVSEEVYRQIKQLGGSSYSFSNNYPGNGGPDGWRIVK